MDEGILMLDQRMISIDIDKFLNTLLAFAIERRSSDIHLQPEDNFGKIRLRIDGKLIDIMRISIENFEKLTSKVKLEADMDIAEKRLPQDSALRIETFPDIDFRISSINTIVGEKIVIRILSLLSFWQNSKLLGFREDSKNKLYESIKKSSGMIIISGPTGSGKSTSLYALLSRLNKEDVNIVTIEDPVEYKIENINQISINEKIGLTYPKILKSILRQDPDIIMVGEIRDSETAQIAIRAAITGHLVLTTTHTRDALSTLVRLKDLGVDDYLLRSAINVLASQRLVRKLCFCKKKDTMTDFEYNLVSEFFNVSRDINIYRPSSCPNCSGGYKSRQAIEEVIILDNEFKDLLRQYGLESKEIKNKLKKDKFRSMLVNGISQILNGETSFEEVLSVIEI